MLADKLDDWKPGYTTYSQYSLNIVPCPAGDNPDATRPSGRGCFREGAAADWDYTKVRLPLDL